MSKLQYVANLRAKDDVNEIFLVKYLAQMEGKDGKSYVNFILSDASGDMESRKWHDAHETIQAVSKGNWVKVQGKVNAYQGRLQLIVQEITSIDLPQDYNKDDFVPKVDGDVLKMKQELDAIVAGLDDLYIRQLLINILKDEELSSRLLCWHAGKSVHHAYQGGLLEHILSCSKLALDLSTFYQVNKNYVVAGAILHDLCKIYELSEGPVVEYTDEGKLVGHLSKSIQMIEFFVTEIKNFPKDLKDHLVHILISHHGEYAYGSPKLPQTREAMLVHLIDMMDSRMNAFDSAIKTDKVMGRWTGFIKHLDRAIFKQALPFYPEIELPVEAE